MGPPPLAAGESETPSATTAPPAPTPARPPRPWEHHLAWLAPLALYLVLRLFADWPYWSLGTDQSDYLVLARSFPYHRLFNNQLYLIHPPVWGYVIGLTWRALRPLGVSLATTGLLAEFSFVLATFFLVRAYARHNRLSPAGTAVALLYLSLSTLVLATQEGVSRFPILVAEVGLCLLLFERWLADPRRTRLPWSVAALTALTLLTSDNGLLLLPSYLLTFSLHPSRSKWRPFAGLLLLSSLAALAWPAVRLGVYLAHDQFPAGMAGTVESTRPVPWAGVLQPNLLPITAAHNAVMGHTGITGADPRRLADYLSRLALPPSVPTRPILATLLLASLLPGLRLRLTPADVRARILPDQWPTTVKLVGLSALATLPILVGLYPWYAAPFAIPFPVLLGRGADFLLARSPATRRLAVAAAAALCLALSGAWLTQSYVTRSLWNDVLPGRHFLFARIPWTPTAGIAPQLAALGMDPNRDGVMTPVGIAESLTLTSHYRATCYPLDPAALNPIARRYHLTHLLLTEGSLVKPLGGPKARRYSGWETARYVADHPDQFPPLGTATQTYPDGTTATYRLYRIAATTTP